MLQAEGHPSIPHGYRMVTRWVRGQGSGVRPTWLPTTRDRRKDVETAQTLEVCVCVCVLTL